MDNIAPLPAQRPAGLRTDDAALLLRQHGRNELPSEPGPTVLGRIAAQLRDPMILLLCGALALVVAVGDHADAVIIAAVIVVNTAIGVTQKPLIPKVRRPIKQRQPFDIFEDQYTKLKRIAEAEKGFENGRSMNKMVRDAIDHYLRDHPERKK